MIKLGQMVLKGVIGYTMQKSGHMVLKESIGYTMMILDQMVLGTQCKNQVRWS